MATTPTYKLPYPIDSDAPNGPQEIKDLAEKVEDIIEERAAAAATELLAFASGARINGSEAKTVTGSEGDVVGATKTLVLAHKSLVFVSAQFDFDVKVGTSLTTSAAAKGGAIGYLNVDGSNQSNNAELLCATIDGGGQLESAKVQACVAQSYALTLAAGSHTIKLRCKTFTEGSSIFVETATAWIPHTGFTYIVLPIA